jgi:hypothetical protein
VVIGLRSTPSTPRFQVYFHWRFANAQRAITHPCDSDAIAVQTVGLFRRSNATAVQGKGVALPARGVDASA